MIWQGNYKPLIISLKEARYSSDSRQGMEGEKPRLPGDLVVAKVRKRFLDH